MAPFIQSLPNEVLHNIAPRLPPDAYLALRLTCREINSRLLPRSDEWGMTELLRVERWRCYNSVGQSTFQVTAHFDYFACHRCLKIRRAVNFADTMLKSAFGKRNNFSTRPKAALRKCLDCGITDKQYPLSRMIPFGCLGGGHGFFCGGCQNFVPGPRDWTLHNIRVLFCAGCSRRPLPPTYLQQVAVYTPEYGNLKGFKSREYPVRATKTPSREALIGIETKAPK